MGSLTRKLMAGTAAVGAVFAVCSTQALAGVPLAPADLAVTARELPGFAHARRFLEATTSAFAWAHSGVGGTWTSYQEEVPLLEASGFQEGVQAGFTGRRREHGRRPREAASQVALFASDAAAQRESERSIGVLSSEVGAELIHFAVPGIPGATGIGSFSAREHSGVGNVLFRTGRCAIAVGDALRWAGSAAQVDRAPIAGALALYRRTRPVCA
jgi:hypothetical protein